MANNPDFPKELKYSKTHEYLRILANNQATIGITSYATSELGDIVYVELPEVGSTLNSKEKFGVIESVKSVSDLYLPINGKVIEVNKDLNNHPEYINQDTYGKGWMIRIELLEDPEECNELITSSEYTKFVLAETH